MSTIKLTRFVDINIVSHSTTSISGTRNQVILFTPEGTSSTVREVTSSDYTTYYPNTSGTTTTYAYLTVFFAHGGKSVKVYEGIGYSGVGTAITTLGLDLDYDHIILCCAVPSADIASAYTALKTVASNRALPNSGIYGINEKIIVARKQATPADTDKVKNFAVKYDPDSTKLGIEMTIAAYLSVIDVYRANTVKDYSFTTETITAANVTDSDFETIVNNNMNVDVTLAGAVRNIGGNCKDGADLANSYVRIILHQTLTNKLIALLTEKIKGSTGISKIYTTIAQELENYLVNGYLSTDKTWTDEDYVVSYGSKQYTIIEKGTALTNGYLIRVLPLSSLTAADKELKKAPPIYVVIADQYGIRFITINGEVI